MQSKLLTLSLFVLVPLSGCATIKSLDEVRNLNTAHANDAHEAGRDASVKFDQNEFNDVYEGKAKLKTLGIIFTALNWDLKGWRKTTETDFMGPGSAFAEHRQVVDAVMNEIKVGFEKYGYQVLTPTEMAKKSPTYASIKLSDKVEEFSPTSGQEFQSVASTGSRYIDKFFREGELISKINKEAGVDAVISFHINEIDGNATETKIGDTKLLGAGGKGDAFLVVCVSNEKAKENGMSFGLFGQPNHCGTAQATIVAGRYLPALDSRTGQHFEEAKKVGFEGMTRTYTSAAKGMVEEFYDEGLKD